ncbi:RNA polymerase factor sigma-54 [Caproicibacter sp. BJN0012]|uniref:RNA polymerase factor sigma-54 n=1 Tax=Caproicibacter sp. BJN0012 TaxID=3110227 RepID=UPI002E11AC11|nr:RNA polymerase factor sigma-54 [Caproicibacter sp. BJN0012]
MGLRPGVSQEQKQNLSQKLILSAKLRESLDILQMPLPDLLRKVEDEIMENPVLDCDGTERNGEMDETENLEFKSWQGKNPGSRNGQGHDLAAFDKSQNNDPFQFVSKEPTFSDFLREQLGEIKMDLLTTQICQYLIEDLDERGYLPETAEAIADDLRITDVRLVEKAIRVIQLMEPAGVGAYDLRECLALQLQRMPGCNPAEFKIVDRYLKLLADNKVKLIAEKLDVSVSDALRFCNQIRKLNPIPSSGFNTGALKNFIIPEATIRKDDLGNFKVEMNRPATYHLSINPYYKKMAQITEDEKTKKYIREKIIKASLLIDAISDRASTISKILEKIIEFQPFYFSKGTSCLSPMTMTSVAEQLGLNESTVSRAVQDKFILCPWGIVRLKSLFTQKLTGSDSNQVFSSVYVKDKIKEMISTERKERPLSDQKIALALNRIGILISRRTVSKYRESLEVFPAAKRKSL